MVFSSSVVPHTAARDYLEGDCQNCLMRIENDAGQMECLMEQIRIQCVRDFGDTSHCDHPAARQFVNLVNSCLAKFDERRVSRG